MAKPWTLRKLTAAPPLDIWARVCVCVCVDLLVRLLHGCLVRWQFGWLRAEQSSTVTEITLYIWFGLPSNGAICLCDASVGTSATPCSCESARTRTSACDSVCVWICRICLHFCLLYMPVYGWVNAICLCAWVWAKIHTEQLEGSFNLITYWDMSVTRLWSSYLVSPSSAGCFIISACHSKHIKTPSIFPVVNFFVSLTKGFITHSFLHVSLFQLVAINNYNNIEWL